MKKMKMIIVVLIVMLVAISTAYAVTIIKASDVMYDNSKSNGSSNNVQGAIDELYSMAENAGSGSSTSSKNMIKYITNLANTDTTNLAYDDTADKNLRYIGANPNNYVEFNGELWRIIGIMNNVEDANGNKASRVKLMKTASIGQYQWDNRSTYGLNDWTTASLMKILNTGDYWNRTNSLSSKGLTEDAKSMITKVVWNLGGREGSQASAAQFYAQERGTSVYSERKSRWTGYVGLVYPSDYGYAVGGSVRSTCLAGNLGSYKDNNCYQYIYMYNATYQWTLTPIDYDESGIIPINGNGWVGSWYANNIYYRANYSYNTHPVVYLNTNINIASGSGTSTDPYILTTKNIGIDNSNASPPKIDDEEKLKPVTLADDGTVTYVSQDDEEWYNYTEKRWANAVILVDSPSTTYKVGDTIKESDIESYFVWIPKYKYKLWNTGTASKKVHEIEIEFDTKDTTDIEGKSCKTPMTTGATGNCSNGEWMTHPVFISLGVDGFWVGKFETGYKGATSTSNAQVTSSDSSKIIIKPNVYSWRNNTVYNFFTSAYNYERNLDSHMMKNTEWGAVAYLSHSKYGLGYEININNNSSYKTGYSALPTTNQHTYPGIYGDSSSYNQPYNTSVGYMASTTGNITGIYDMSGGAWEYMATYIDGKSGSSGFTTTTLANYNAKYFDVYNASSTINYYHYRILGDATGEMGPFQYYLDGDNFSRWHSSWYDDYSEFNDSNYPWFGRGGYYGDGNVTGAFYFSRGNGAVYIPRGSRLVLTG